MDRYIVGLFDDEEVLLKAVKNVKQANFHIHEVVTPFPVHGLDDALGIKASRLHIVGFTAGLLGCLFALSFITWVTTSNYPINFGGKPFFALPAYIPITFEITVLAASVTMVVAFFVRSGLSVFASPKIYDERTTDYLFGMAFKITEDSKEEDIARINELLKENGVVEIKDKDFESTEY